MAPICTSGKQTLHCHRITQLWRCQFRNHKNIAFCLICTSLVCKKHAQKTANKQHYIQYITARQKWVKIIMSMREIIPRPNTPPKNRRWRFPRIPHRRLRTPPNLPGSDGHPKDPPEVPQGPPKDTPGSGLFVTGNSPAPPHFSYMSLLIFTISHHGTFRKFKEITTVALLPCENAHFWLVGNRCDRIGHKQRCNVGKAKSFKDKQDLS